MDSLISFITTWMSFLWPFLAPIIASIALIVFVLVSAIFSVWLERKVAARIQDRLGPTRVGGKFGWFQGLADGIKLILKEDTIPAAADEFLFRVGPYVVLVGSFLAFVVLPFGNGAVAKGMNIGVFFILAVMSTEVFGIILIGYGSGSKWSLFGGMREAAQMISYEIPMALCVLIPVVVAGTMNMQDLAMQQSGGMWNWRIFHDPFTFGAFWTYYTCALASCKRAPFDLAEAESELVAGFHTEYSGFRWLIIYMAEYGSMFAVSGIALVLFLGGWSLGLGFEMTDVFGMIFGNLINIVVFIFKGWFLVLVMMWVRWTLPRLRIDQVMKTCLKYLIPISCVLLVGVSLWLLVMPVFVVDYFKWVLFLASAGAVATFLWKVFTWASAPPGSGMPGMWRMVDVVGYQADKQHA